MSLILASASPIRAQLLRQNLVPLKIEPARVDEAAIKSALLAEDAPPRDIADTLAEVKAKRIANKFPEGLVLGADQILVHGTTLIDKAPDLATLRAQLATLRGSAHTLLSAAVIYERNQPVWRHIGQAQMIMRDFSDTFLDAYIAQHGDDLLTTVGGYRLETDGPSLFSRVQGDYFSVLGMPLLEVLAFLRSRGVIAE
ncbi:MAG: Maf family protein [Pseudomonadota bacterium]